MRTRGMIGAVALSLAALVGCSEESALVDPTDGGALEPARSDRAAGAVYLMNNAAAGNEVMVFHRAPDGSLTQAPNVPTGGLGTDETGLGNQGALALTQDRRWLLVVNAGSDDVSVFGLRPGGLVLTDRETSGGTRPVSVAVHGDLVYVLNAGEPNNVSGFRLTHQGALDPIAGSTRPLSADMTGPAQVGFTPDGRVLVVTEKATNRITTYAIDRRSGLASMPNVQAAAGETPFGFDRHGTLIVSEAFGGAADAATVSSYDVAASGTVTGFHVAASGDLTLLDADGVTAPTGMGSAPIDAAFSSGGRYLYVLARGIGEIRAFAFESDGGLTPISGAAGLLLTANGMAAY